MNLGYKVNDKVVLIEDFKMDGVLYKRGLRGRIDKISGGFFKEYDVTFSDGRRVGFAGSSGFKKVK
jgi:hypothetical protein